MSVFVVYRLVRSSRASSFARPLVVVGDAFWIDRNPCSLLPRSRWCLLSTHRCLYKRVYNYSPSERPRAHVCLLARIYIYQTIAGDYFAKGLSVLLSLTLVSLVAARLENGIGSRWFCSRPTRANACEMKRRFFSPDLS
jgi:hypothetical protein